VSTQTEPGNYAEDAAIAADLSNLDLEDDCPRCEGVGVVSDAAWMAWHERESAVRRAWRHANPGGDWWSTPESKAFEAETPESDAEEHDCPKCRGCGQVPTAAGQRLLSFLRNQCR
jgi:Zn-finger nucleic acid-binding protein